MKNRLRVIIQLCVGFRRNYWRKDSLHIVRAYITYLADTIGSIVLYNVLWSLKIDFLLRFRCNNDAIAVLMVFVQVSYDEREENSLIRRKDRHYSRIVN